MAIDNSVHQFHVFILYAGRYPGVTAVMYHNNAMIMDELASELMNH